MRNKQWQGVVALCAGIWLAASPWLLGHEGEPTKMLYSCVISGLAMAMLAIADMAKPDRREPVVNMILGFWAIASPWLLGFADDHSMMVSTVTAGVIGGAASLWQIVERYDLPNRMPQ